MKRLVYFLLGCMVLAACDIETSKNGDFDGFWQLASIDTLGGPSGDTRERFIFWCVQGTLIETYIAADYSPAKEIVFTFDKTGDSLFLHAPYVSDRSHGDIPVENVSQLSPYGINQLEERFKIQHLSGDDMTLESAMLRLHFRKY